MVRSSVFGIKKSAKAFFSSKYKATPLRHLYRFDLKFPALPPCIDPENSSVINISNRQRKLFLGIFSLMAFSPEVSAVRSEFYLVQARNPDSSCVVIFHKNDSNNRLCSGDIVGRDKLLTAAHCIPTTDETAIIRCRNQKMIVKGYLAHPRYRVSKFTPFDYALLQTESDFFALMKVRLPKNGEEVQVLMEHGNCAIFGYGFNSEGMGFSLFGGSIDLELNSSLGFQLAVFSGPSISSQGDSGGGLFCLLPGYTPHPDHWIRIATLSQTGRLPGGGELGTAALLSDSILEWIRESIDKDLPLVSGFSPTVDLQTVDPDDMESSEECVLRLVAEAACIHSVNYMEALTAEITFQCGREESPDFLLSLLENSRKMDDCFDPDIQEPSNLNELKDMVHAGGLLNEFRNLRKGQTVRVPEYKWVVDLDRTDDSCSIEYGGALRILGFSPDGRFAVATNHPLKIGGALCPDRALIILSARELAGFDKFYTIRKQEEIKKQEEQSSKPEAEFSEQEAEFSEQEAEFSEQEEQSLKFFVPDFIRRFFEGLSD